MEKQTNDNLADRVLSRIEHDRIEPKPAWHFLLHDSVVWGVALCSILLGSTASALSLYIHDASRFMVRSLSLSDLGGLVQFVPVFWLVLLGVALFYGVHAVRETRRGYRYNPKWLIVCAVVCSIMAGALANAAGLGARIDQYLLSEVPAYRPLSGYIPMHWTSTSSGVVAGVVQTIDDDTFLLHTVDDRVLEVRMDQETHVLLPLGVHDGARVQVVATSTLERASTTTNAYEELRAEEIMPFRGRGPGRGDGEQRMRNQGFGGNGTGRGDGMR